MHKALLFIFTSLLALPALTASATEALLAEQRDAAWREQQELQERATALAEQLDEARRLLALQDAYLERLTQEVARHGGQAEGHSGNAGAQRARTPDAEAHP